MTSKQALEYLTSNVFTGGNSILEIEAEECAKIINQDLDKLGLVTNEYKNLAIDYGKKDQQCYEYWKEIEKFKKIIAVLQKHIMRNWGLDPLCYLQFTEGDGEEEITLEEDEILKEFF